MPSPDISPYVDLTLFDQESQSIYQRAIDYARVALPEFAPEEGSIETVLLQALALEVSDAIFSINRVPNAITEVLLKLLDVQRSAGAKAKATVKFTGFTTASFFVPSGTRLFYQADETSPVVLLETTSSLTGSHTKSISLISSTGGSTAQVTTSTPHGLVTGNTVSISGTGVTAFNSFNGAVTVVNSTQFTISGSFVASSAATGTVTPAATIPATGFVEAETTLLTADFNGLPAETVFTVLSVVPQVASASLFTALLGGQSPESDDEYFSRGTTTLRRITTGLSTATQVQNFVLEPNRFSSVYRATVLDNTSAQRQENVSGRFLVVAAPIDASSTNLLSGLGDGTLEATDPSYGDLDQIYDGVVERINALTSFAVTHPSFLKVAVTTTVKAPVGLDSNTVSAKCQEVLNDYLSTNTWPWDTTIRLNELIVQLRNAIVTVGTATYPAIGFVQSISVEPVDVYVPVTSTNTVFPVSAASWAGGTVTIVTPNPHGITVPVGQTLYVKVVDTNDSNYDTSELVPVTAVTSTTFQFAKAGSGSALSSPAGYVIAAAIVDGDGNVVILDPAPLVESDDHTVVVI